MNKREIAAFALAPLPVVAPCLTLIGFFLVDPPKDWVAGVGAMLELILFSYGITLLIGVPVHLLLRRVRQTALAAYIGLTILIVIVIAAASAVLDLMAPISVNDNPFALHMWSGFGIRLALVAAAFSSVSAGIFWSVAVRRARS